jgi:hypothetical protein
VVLAGWPPTNGEKPQHSSQTKNKTAQSKSPLVIDHTAAAQKLIKFIKTKKPLRMQGLRFNPDSGTISLIH